MSGVVDIAARGPRAKSRAADELALEVLDLRDRKGLKFSEIAKVLTEKHRFVVTKNMCISIANRCGNGTELPCVCQAQENRDGGMPARWWAK